MLNIYLCSKEYVLIIMDTYERQFAIHYLLKHANGMKNAMLTFREFLNEKCIAEKFIGNLFTSEHN